MSAVISVFFEGKMRALFGMIFGAGVVLFVSKKEQAGVPVTLLFYRRMFWLIIFGLIHAFNDHKNAHIQAMCATVAGILFGITAAQFGLAASIAAHMVNNTMAVTFLKAYPPANRAPDA